MNSFGKRIEDYEVHNLLGKGGFASVYHARCLKTHTDVAIKMIDKKLMQATGMVNRVKQEVAIHSRLKHPSILELYECFEDINYVYLVLELCHKGELQKYVKGKVLSETEVSNIMIQVVEGIKYLHSYNILHRDLSLSNLLLTKDMQVKIADFGLATQLSRPDEKHMTMCGTPNFISPEVASRGSHGLEADVWGLGCLLYTLLVGSPPFDTPAVKSTLTKVVLSNYTLPDHLSSEAKDLINSLLQKNPKDRITLDQILEHPFLKRTRNVASHLNHDSGIHTMSSKRDDSAFCEAGSVHCSCNQHIRRSNSDCLPCGNPHSSLEKGRIRSCENERVCNYNNPPRSQSSQGYSCNKVCSYEETARPPERMLNNYMDFDTAETKAHKYNPERKGMSQCSDKCQCPSGGGGGSFNYGFNRSMYSHHSDPPYNEATGNYLYSHSNDAPSRPQMRSSRSENDGVGRKEEYVPKYARPVPESHDLPLRRMNELVLRSSDTGFVQKETAMKTDIASNFHDVLPKYCEPVLRRTTEVIKENRNSVPLCSERLLPTRHQTKNTVLSILKDGEVCIEFIKRRGSGREVVCEVMRISADGMRVVTYEPEGSPFPNPDGPPPPKAAGADRICSFDNLSDRQRKKYSYAAKFVELVRAKTPKVTYYTDKGKCFLMESLEDFEMCFYDGHKITESPSDGVVLTTPSGDIFRFRTASECSASESSMSPVLRLAWKHSRDALQHCKALERALADLPKTSFPAIIGRRLQQASEGKENSPRHGNIPSFTVSVDGSVASSAAVPFGHRRSGNSNNDTANSSGSGKQRRVAVPGVGVAWQTAGGEVKVRYADGSQLAVDGKHHVRYQYPDGRTVDYQDTEVLPRIIVDKLQHMPKVLKHLAPSPVSHRIYNMR
nr:unnamed protein product [Callosobruchus analis]